MTSCLAKIIVPTGMLGAGIQAEHVRYGIQQGAHAIAVDSGSTDSGPSYLARGVSKMNRQSIKNDLTVLISEAYEADIPILVGTCGTAGTNSGVDWTAEIAREVVLELGIKRKISCLYSEQSKDDLVKKLHDGRINPLPPSGELDKGTLMRCEHIVALMGPEPYIEALSAGADIVLGGRTTDTAVIAAMALMRGAGAGPSWHAAKIAECGGQCTVNPFKGGVLISIGTDSFDVEPLSIDNSCTPESVSAHMLYENSDPNIMWEPGGVLDVTNARYSKVDERITRVSHSEWKPSAYTMKLEGASAGPFQTIMLIGIEDPFVLANLDEFHEKMLEGLTQRVRRMFGTQADDIEISIRLYGWNGTSGKPVPADTPSPIDAGVLFVATAPTQDLANQVAKACNPMFFHMPLRADIELPSYAFPFTPAEIPRGQVYRFELNHVVHTESAHELVQVSYSDVGASS